MRLADGTLIGEGRPCFVIAEAGVNHNGEVQLAHDLVDVAAEARADAVKFQTFDPAALSGEAAETAPYQVRTTGLRSQRGMLESLTLPASAWAELRDHAAERGLVFLSTPFDVGSAELLLDLGVPALKVPSGELDNLPFIRSLARLDRPLLISTGMGTLDEVKAALDAAAEAPGTALFHCVTAYPTPAGDANLLAIRTLRQQFEVPVGWSDHTVGPVTAVASVALGAALIEKHLTLDRGMAGPDHEASEDPGSFAFFVEAVREAETALGDGVKRPRPSEEPNRIAARRSWHAARDLATGTTLADADVVALRPATGLSPSVPVAGLTLVRDVAAGAVITAADLTSRPDAQR
ncbi:MAG: N-acetylneuraminate synthase family protein [Actinobacteria bacterium]|nr:N-acetylneuraminate synthase family protein [Actinomycetota bacterium]